MSRDEALHILRSNWDRLQREFGVRSLVMIGSVARNDANDVSDVDLLVDFGRPTGYFGLVRLQFYLQEILGRDVDLGTRGSLRPSMQARIEREAIRVA